MDDRVSANGNPIAVSVAIGNIDGPLRYRRLAALGAAGAIGILTVLGVLPVLYTLPTIGLLSAWASPRDERPDLQLLTRSPVNLIIGLLLIAMISVVALQHRLLPYLLAIFDAPGRVVALLGMVALALPLAMVQSIVEIDEMPPHRVAVTRRNVALALTGVVTVATWHATVGQGFVVLAALVLGLPVVLGAWRVRQARRGRVEPRLWRHPLRPGFTTHRVQFVNVLLVSALLGMAMRAGTFDVLRLYLPIGGYSVFLALFFGGLLGFVALGLFPLSRVFLATNLAMAAGSVFLAVQLVMISQTPTEPVTIESPLHDEWYVSQGGHSGLVNYHYVTSAQRDSLDIVKVVDGHTHPIGSRDVESYYIFGDPLLAPSDGVVVEVVDGLPDQEIGSADSRHLGGNHLVIDISGGRYILLAHLRQGSIQVAIGDQITAGQPIAEVGNSGNTTEPHIHIQAFNLPSFESAEEDLPEFLRTARTYPLVFRDVVLTRNGSATTPSAVDPRRGDMVRPRAP